MPLLWGCIVRAGLAPGVRGASLPGVLGMPLLWGRGVPPRSPDAPPQLVLLPGLDALLAGVQVTSGINSSWQLLPAEPEELLYALLALLMLLMQCA